MPFRENFKKKAKREAQHDLCVVLLTCVNFNELAFIIHHVSLKHPIFKPSRKKLDFSCLVVFPWQIVIPQIV